MQAPQFPSARNAKWQLLIAAKLLTEQRTVELQTSPFDVARFVASWRAHGAPMRILLAVSGGSDSMALLRIAAEARQQAEEKERFSIVAATVNHGLRTEALAEAHQVGAWCSAINVPFLQLDWTGKKPATGIQSAARTMRYRLLVEAAIAQKCDVIMTGHTQDDLAETVLMRLRRASGARGLASMMTRFSIASGPSVPIPLVRPLLAARRDDLKRYLRGIDQPYLSDPSNDDLAYERIRIRRSLANGESDYDHRSLVVKAREAHHEKQTAEHQEQGRFKILNGALSEWGGASLIHTALDLTSKTDIGLVARLIRAVGCLLYTSPSPRDLSTSRMPSSA